MPFNLNWYDIVVLLALLYGIWSGVRNGLTGEFFNLVGAVLLVVLSVKGYVPVGQWLHDKMVKDAEQAHLIAFVGIVVGMFALILLVRWVVDRFVKKKKKLLGAITENVGGGLAGVVRMAVIMTVLTVTLCLMRSEFWHVQVGRQSRVGAFLLRQLPTVKATVEKHFPENLWIAEKLKRRTDPSVEDESSQKTK